MSLNKAAVSLSLPTPTRTSDGTSAVGAVVVSRLKMGEIEDGEVDHIAADVPGQKVGRPSLGRED